MTTYSAFDPGATRTLLHSGVSVSVPTLNVPSLPDMVARRGVVAAPKVVSGKIDTTGTATITTTAVAPFKPWPYSLPAFLRPKVGTTFEMMHHTTSTTTFSTSLESVEDEKLPKRIGVLQALLYGIPEPGKFSYAKEVVSEGSFVHKMLYGVKEIEHGSGEAAIVFSKVKVEINEDREEKAVEIREVEVKKVDLEKQYVGRIKAFEMVAK